MLYICAIQKSLIILNLNPPRTTPIFGFKSRSKAVLSSWSSQSLILQPINPMSQPKYNPSVRRISSEKG